MHFFSRTKYFNSHYCLYHYLSNDLQINTRHEIFRVYYFTLPNTFYPYQFLGIFTNTFCVVNNQTNQYSI